MCHFITSHISLRKFLMSFLFLNQFITAMQACKLQTIVFTIIIITIIQLTRSWATVDPYRSHTSKNLFNGLPWFPLRDGLQLSIAHSNLLLAILLTLHPVSSVSLYFVQNWRYIYFFCHLCVCSINCRSSTCCFGQLQSSTKSHHLFPCLSAGFVVRFITMHFKHNAATFITNSI